MDKNPFISTKSIIDLNNYKPLKSDLNLIIDNSKEYIKWVLGFNNNITNDPKEIEYRVQVKWALLKCR